MRRFLSFLLLFSCWTAVLCDVLKDLSGGFCRSWRFATNISNRKFRMMDLDGGLIPGDLNSTHNYMIEIDLSQDQDLTNGASYPMSLVDKAVPIIKDQAWWPNQDGSKIFLYGGRGASNTQVDDGIWEYHTQTNTWHRQPVGSRPIRLAGGAYANAPAIQAAYWIGGYQSSDTTPEITDDKKIYPSGMMMLNTTTNEIRNITTPFGSTQGGAVVFLPTPGMGSLVYIGGEVVKTGTSSAGTPRPMSSVWVFDVASETWFEQDVVGDALARQEFCAVSASDGNGGWHLYIMGGADYNKHVVTSEISMLAVPSFKWYSTGTWFTPRMSINCEIVGKQLLAVGGRLALANGAEAGCYGTPVLNWDLNQRATVSTWDSSEPTYSPAASIVSDTSATPTPSKWAGALKEVFFPSKASASGSSATGTATGTAAAAAKSSSNTAAIAGGVAAGVVVLIALGVGIFFYRRRHQQQKPKEGNVASTESLREPMYCKAELSNERDPQEMDGLGQKSTGFVPAPPPQEMEVPLPMQPSG
ncbi:hypothetical protein FN846DRAFT_926013 [Sphaerosporella brunnea]|uniref:Kelch repeat protein n=1 Tax=Sphaerosporella brunnea TaxID=1250544 RepID=A0A5J5FC01_9PEZI|nr:hypothetical protein FN846DRAFT_926013 [Sphaerosporella brunnea]